ALNNVTLPHALRIANRGWREALLADPHLKAGLNVWNGKITYQAVAEDLGYDYMPVDKALAA
ncbi:MAG TPA: alanine dehydrogenase, partial [Thermohalobaculum sp.]|nr:alanine dehydrogenase [Thermohalobaculum sp.]